MSELAITAFYMWVRVLESKLSTEENNPKLEKANKQSTQAAEEHVKFNAQPVSARQNFCKSSREYVA